MEYKISVLMSIYEKENPIYFLESLNSIINQTLTPNQIVIVRDGKLTDELNKIIDKKVNRYPNLIDVIEMEENRGLGYSLNMGLKVCKYDLVARMDCDDIAEPNRFEEQVKEFKKNMNLDILGSNATMINMEGIKKSQIVVPESNCDIKKIIWTCPIIHPTVMFKKQRIIEIGGYSDLRRRQDYELWFRAYENKLNFKNIQKPLLLYRTDEDSFNKKNNRRVQLTQFKIGIKGIKRNNLGFISYLGVTANFFFNLLPAVVKKSLGKCVDSFDPRRR